MSSDPRRGRRLAAVAPILAIFSASLALFLAGPYRGSGDTEPAELLPISILEHHRLDFDRFYGNARDLPYAFRRVDGHVVSAYPIVAGLANVPVFAVARLAGYDLFTDRLRLSHATAALLAAGSAVFLFLALTRILERHSHAFLFTAVYVLGTLVWSVVGRGLWQHAPSLLFLCAALWLLTFRERGPLAAAGLALGGAVVSRATNLPMACAAALFILFRRPRAFPGFFALAAVPGLLATMYSGAMLGSVLAFGSLYRAPRFDGGIFPGLAGLLFSPSRGLFVFSPILLASLPGARVVWRSRDERLEPLRWLMPGAAAVIVLHAAWPMWWGGASFGYRLIVDVVPVLVLLAAAAWAEASRRLAAAMPAIRAAFVLLFAVSASVQLLGILTWPTDFDAGLDLEPARLWNVRDSELAFAGRKLNLFGSAYEAAGSAGDTAGLRAVWWTPALDDDAIPGWVDATPGGKTIRGALTISGWAKSAAGEVEVRIAVDDGRVLVPERFPRPDVAAVLPELGDTSTAGFRATISPPAGLSKPHAISIEMRGPGGRVRRLGPIQFNWGP